MECPICKTQNVCFGELKFYAIDKKDVKIPFYICDCSFLYYRHDAVNEQYLTNNKYVNANTGSGASSIFDLKRLDQSLSIVVDRLKLSGGNILDVGCNNGNFIRKLMTAFNDCNFFGMDMIINANVINDLKNIKAMVAQTTDIEFFGKAKMDFISVLHVLEHVDNLNQFILGLKGALTNEGLIYIEVPDAARYHEYFVTPYSYFDLEHINHFTLPALTHLFLSHDLEIESSFVFDIDMSETVKYPVLGAFFKNKK